MSESVQDASMKFNKAASYLSTATSLAKVSTAIKLELYGLFKYVTVSTKPNTSRPSIFDMTGRAKWDAWSSAGNLYATREDAERKYLEIAKSLGWEEDATETTPPPTIEEDEDNESSGGMGVSVSMMPRPVHVNDETIHGLAVSNDISGLSTFLDSHTTPEINGLDEFGYTPLHLASDRGHLPIVKLLRDRGADIAIKDPDGLTALELATIAGHDDIRDCLLSS